MGVVLEKLKSRKFWVTVATIAIGVFGPQLGMSTEQIYAVTGAGGLFTASQAYVDSKRK